MKWSLKLGRVRGILIQVHWTFFILIAYVVMVYSSGGANIAGVTKGVALVLAMFGCVVLHALIDKHTASRRDGFSGVQIEEILDAQALDGILDQALGAFLQTLLRLTDHHASTARLGDGFDHRLDGEDV